MLETLQSLTNPPRLWRRNEVLATPSPVPASAGIYGWYFDGIPKDIDVSECHSISGRYLMYVGIAPKAPAAGGGRASSQTLRKRICYHYGGNAEGSTLRLTLGCLLSGDLGIELRRVGSGKRLTFGSGEAVLSEWMAAHAFVCWAQVERAWEVEHFVISTLDLPLNLDRNRRNTFHPTLTKVRAEAKARARQLPILGREEELGDSAMR